MEKKISVVIPNYNGEGLLRRNLPKIIKCLPNTQIIVVDDASTDSSAALIKKEFKRVILVELSKNLGFGGAVNKGVKASEGDLIVLLNSDVIPRENFLKPALKYFKKNDTFGVGFADASHEKGKIVTRGRGGASFRQGLFVHFALPPERDITLWVSGGSSIIDKKKFMEIGGFDEIYSPYYWEDIDLCYRAWKNGYKSYFEPQSVVDHYHEIGSIKTTQSSKKIKSIAYRNQFIFIWKNIQSESLAIQHLLFLPYYILKSIIAVDFPFLSGFFQALIKLPNLLFKSDNIENKLVSDEEILVKFAK